MSLVIKQIQNRNLLEEHAKSSFNFTFLGKNELFVAIAFLLIGGSIALINEQNRIVGVPFLIIGMLEVIKYPSRVSRWVKKKEKESIFGKDIEFEISPDILKITINQATNTHKYCEMKKCLVSRTGILFKISIKEYYYISFKSVGDVKKQEDLINVLNNGFETSKIKINR